MAPAGSTLFNPDWAGRGCKAGKALTSYLVETGLYRLPKEPLPEKPLEEI